VTPRKKVKRALFHIDPIALKSNPFHFKQSALVQSCFSGKQNPASETDHAMPWDYL
jgi:hypothetical protein